MAAAAAAAAAAPQRRCCCCCCSAGRCYSAGCWRRQLRTPAAGASAAQRAASPGRSCGAHGGGQAAEADETTSSSGGGGGSSITRSSSSSSGCGVCCCGGVPLARASARPGPLVNETPRFAPPNCAGGAAAVMDTAAPPGQCGEPSSPHIPTRMPPARWVNIPHDMLKHVCLPKGGQSHRLGSRLACARSQVRDAPHPPRTPSALEARMLTPKLLQQAFTVDQDPAVEHKPHWGRPHRRHPLAPVRSLHARAGAPIKSYNM